MGSPCALAIQLILPLILLATAPAFAQTQTPRVPFDRLPVDQFDVTPPAERVAGGPGEMHTRKAACRVLPLAQARRRIVDVAVQEWGFFGFPIVDRTVEQPRRPRPSASRSGQRRRRQGGDPVEGARVAASIGGYWSVTPEGFWVIDQQNGEWTGEWGTGARWNAPWSAAFISWVMCEAGLGENGTFKRAVAHHTYIDQAIQARDAARQGGKSSAAFLAYEVGEAPVETGDLLCSSSRPSFRSIAERRRQLGEGARMHCDIVVKVDPAIDRILTVGGNVGGRVSMKIMASIPRGKFAGPSSDPIFAHLKLQTGAIESDALDHSPTMEAQACAATPSPSLIAVRNLLSGPPAAVRSC